MDEFISSRDMIQGARHKVQGPKIIPIKWTLRRVPYALSCEPFMTYERAVAQIDFMLRQTQHERKSHMVLTYHRSP